MKTSVIEVHDMLSVLTIDEVEERIGKVPGVESTTVNFAAGNATVRYDETRLDVADIKATLHQRGHQSAGESQSKSRSEPEVAGKRAVLPKAGAAPDNAPTPVPSGKAHPVASAAAASAVGAEDGHEGHTAPGATPSTPVAETPKASASAPTPATPQVDENKGHAAPGAEPKPAAAPAKATASRVFTGTASSSACQRSMAH